MAAVAEQAWHNTILAQAGMSWHISSQQSPCIDLVALWALLLKAPRANTKVIRAIQSVLRMAVL